METQSGSMTRQEAVEIYLKMSNAGKGPEIETTAAGDATSANCVENLEEAQSTQTDKANVVGVSVLS